MTSDLKDFFSAIGKAKKEKEDEVRSLVGEIDIDSMFSQVKISLEEDKKKKETQKKQIKALESWLYTEVEEKKEEIIEESTPIVLPYEEDEIEEEVIEEIEEVEEEVEEETEEDAVDHALKILETIKSKEEVRENVSDPEIVKIRGEIEYLKNLVNAQGGGGEVRLEFLDDVDRTTAKVDGKVLAWSDSVGKFIGTTMSAGGITTETQTLNTVLGLGNVSSNGMSVGVVTATSFFGDVTGTATTATNLNNQAASYYLDYDNFTNTPTIPTNNNQLSNGAGYITTSFTNTNQLTNGAGFITASDNITGTSAGLSGSPDIVVGHTTATSLNVTTFSTFNGNVKLFDGKYANFGNSNDLQIVHDGNNAVIQNATGQFFIDNNSTGGDLFLRANDNVVIRIDGNDTVLTAQTGGIDVTGHTETDTLNVSGIATAAEFKGNVTGNVTGDISGNITGTACTFVDGVFTGNVTIGGTLTYEDVTNIDSIGIVTARSGIEIGGPVILNLNTSTSTTTSTSQSAVDTFSVTDYRSANYQVQITRGTEYHVTSLNIVHDGTNVYVSEFGTINTGAILATFTADINSGNVRILATPSSATSTVFKMYRNLIRA